MSVEIEVSASSMLESINSLELTPLVMHRIYIELASTSSWYAVMKEARLLFGKNWRTQNHVKRRLERFDAKPLVTWWEVPDDKFGTWVAVKLAVRVVNAPNK